MIHYCNFFCLYLFLINFLSLLFYNCSYVDFNEFCFVTFKLTHPNHFFYLRTPTDIFSHMQIMSFISSMNSFYLCKQKYTSRRILFPSCYPFRFTFDFSSEHIFYFVINITHTFWQAFRFIFFFFSLFMKLEWKYFFTCNSGYQLFISSSMSRDILQYHVI